MHHASAGPKSRRLLPPRGLLAEVGVILAGALFFIALAATGGILKDALQTSEASHGRSWRPSETQENLDRVWRIPLLNEQP